MKSRRAPRRKSAGAAVCAQMPMKLAGSGSGDRAEARMPLVAADEADKACNKQKSARWFGHDAAPSNEHAARIAPAIGLEVLQQNSAIAVEHLDVARAPFASAGDDLGEAVA